MTTSFRLNVNELTTDILKAIQIAFRNKNIEITISEFTDETEYLLSAPANKKFLEKSIAEIGSGDTVTMSVSEFLEKYNPK